ncbi:MAG TPA: UPF0175 family protein [Candidatus Acidoferrum sp.]|nr:UPF0175 family protein [Candidatus Acidoferrum sp.]
MSRVTLEYPTSWLAALGTDEKSFGRDAKIASGMKLFEIGKLTSEQAATLAEISRSEFLLTCRQWGVNSVLWDDAELRAEFATPLK